MSDNVPDLTSICVEMETGTHRSIELSLTDPVTKLPIVNFPLTEGELLTMLQLLSKVEPFSNYISG